MKKVVINTIPLLSTITGIGRYTLEISKRVQKNQTIETIFYYGYFSKKLMSYKKDSKMSLLKRTISKYPLLKKIARKLLITLSNLTFNKFDLYWEPNFIPIASIKAKKIVTSVHDFSFIHYKEFHPKERIEYFENYFFNNIKRSDAIICFSNYVKQEILNYINIDEKNIYVIYHGVDHNKFKPLKNIKIDIDLPQYFIFCAGSIEPRKNLLRLLKAYNKLDKNLQKKYKLILSGFKGWNNSEIMHIIKQNKNIIYLGYLTEDDLVKVYNLATIFVYPSLYEGFGLPILEAMACNTPVITSNISSMPEVGGDAVIYCDPYSTEDIKNKIELLLKNPKLQKELKTKALKRAKTFTWEKSAKEHLKLFNTLLQNK